MRHRYITPVAGGERLLDDLEGETVRLAPPPPRGIVAVAAAPDGRSDVPGRHRQQLSHDIRHELGTVMMLASLLADSLDVGSAGRRRADQLVVEARWLAALQDWSTMPRWRRCWSRSGSICARAKRWPSSNGPARPRST